MPLARDGHSTATPLPPRWPVDVVRRMTVHEKLGEIVLVHAGPYENINAGVPRLCIPALTLQDGPQGLAYGDLGVTQLPSPLGIAATFDTGVARTYGQVLGSEAAGQGIDVIQGPTLNIDRVPQNGRSYEGFGEDPRLVAAMGVADARGIQSTGTLAMAKHFAVYNQETDRGVLDDQVSQRALEELYYPPFRAAVTGAHVSTAMCAYPQLNGTYQCQDPALLDQLAQWGFTGIIRSDLGSVHDPVAALDAGTDLIKPASVNRLALLVHEHRLSLATVDGAVTRILTEMFAHGLVDRPVAGSPGTAVDSGLAHRLRPDRRRTVGGPAEGCRGHPAPAGARPTGRWRSSAPTPPPRRSPRATGAPGCCPRSPPRRCDGHPPPGRGAHPRHLLGRREHHRQPSRRALEVPDPGLRVGPRTDHDPDPDRPRRHRSALDPGRPAHRRASPSAPIPPPPTSCPARLPAAPVERLRNPLAPGAGALSLGRATSPLHTHVVLPPGWSDVSATWTGTLTPPHTGLYTFSLQGVGAATLTLDGVAAVADPLSHALGRWAQTVSLTGGHPYRLALTWEPIDNRTPSGETSITPSSLTLGWAYVSGRIDAAVAAARRADVAVVFAGDFSSEAFDRPSLSLPGDENALISAVAAANPRTVVVLNTGGPVLMPWLGQVRGVLEAWYPGEEDGAAIAALLFGDVDPSGRLPVTFPARQRPHRGRHPGPVAGDRSDLDVLRGPRGGLPLRPCRRDPAPVSLRLRAVLHPVLPLPAHPVPVGGRVRPAGQGDRTPGAGPGPPSPRPT